MAADNRSVKEARIAGDHRSVKGLEAAIKKEMKTIREARRALAKLEKDTAEPKENGRSSSRSAPIAGLRKKKRVEEQDEGINIYSTLKPWPEKDWDEGSFFGHYVGGFYREKVKRAREKVDKYNAALRQIRRSAKRSGGRMVWTPSKKDTADVRGKK